MSSPALTDVRQPPARWRLAFHLFGMRLPAEHRPWVARLVRTDAQVRRLMVLRLVPLVPAVVLFCLLTRSWTGLGGLIGAALGSLTRVGANRAKLLRWQRIDASGDPVPPRGMARLSNAGAWLLAVAVAALLGLAVYAVERAS